MREQGEVSLDSDGQVLRLEGVILDITEIKARELALNEARLRAETADRAKTEFLGNMSHELRTPLNAVIGFADVLSQQLFGPIPATYGESIAAISQSGRHLLEIISDLLEMSRIESGERRLAEHNSGSGARYTRSRRPVVLVYSEPAYSRAAAAKREYQIKKMPLREKKHLFRG